MPFKMTLKILTFVLQSEEIIKIITHLRVKDQNNHKRESIFENIDLFEFKIIN
jgi:hypothetical protein